MARKASGTDSAHGFNDIIGVALLASALLLLVAQLSFNPFDLAINRDPPNDPAHNWIGPIGAGLAYATFFVFGFSAYILPILLALTGLGCWVELFSYLKRRWPWGIVLLFACMGLLHLVDVPHLGDETSFFTHVRQGISAPSLGGFIGMTLWDWFFWTLGAVGAAIVYGTIYLISLLFLTNFQLGEWVRRIWEFRFKERQQLSPEEQALEKRARELQKQARKLQDDVDEAVR